MLQMALRASNLITTQSHISKTMEVFAAYPSLQYPCNGRREENILKYASKES